MPEPSAAKPLCVRPPWSQISSSRLWFSDLCPPSLSYEHYKYTYVESFVNPVRFRMRSRKGWARPECRKEVSISPDKEHRPHKQHVVMFLMRPGWYLCPASPSVLKVAQRSSPSDPRVLVSATCWSVSITCWGSQTETRARRHPQLTLTTTIVLLARARSQVSHIKMIGDQDCRQFPT